ncbi:MAG TPA: hypothetical protein VF771_14030 [Longimicrobiaceae bacterium]
MTRAARWVGLAAAFALAAGCGDGARGSATSPTAPRVTISGVSISGRNVVPSGELCEFVANVTGGTPPYTYSWSQTWGTGYSLGDTYHSRSYQSYYLYATVTDADGSTVVGTKYVTVGASFPCGLE